MSICWHHEFYRIEVYSVHAHNILAHSTHIAMCEWQKQSINIWHSLWTAPIVTHRCRSDSMQIKSFYLMFWFFSLLNNECIVCILYNNCIIEVWESFLWEKEAANRYFVVVSWMFFPFVCFTREYVILASMKLLLFTLWINTVCIWKWWFFFSSFFFWNRLFALTHFGQLQCNWILNFEMCTINIDTFNFIPFKMCV